MKISKNLFSSALFIGVFLLVFLSFGSKGWAKSKPPANFLFKNIGILPLEDRSGGVLGPDLDRLIQLGFEAYIQFNHSLSKLPSQSLPLGSRKIARLARKHRLDGIISVFADVEGEGVKLGMYLWSGPSGEVFAREFVSFKNRNKPGVMKQAVETLVRKLLSRLPYHSWVLGVGEKGRWVTVNSGLFHGLGKGFVLDLYSLSGIRRSPLTGEFVGAEEDKIGTLKIIEVDQLTASARIINLERGRGISGGEFFRFKPSKEILGSVRADKLAALEKQGSGPPKSSPKDKPVMPPKPLGKKFTGSKGSLSLYLGSAWSRYTLGSSSFTLDRKTSAFPRFKLGAEYWMGSWFGVGGNVSQGFIKFEKVDSVSVDETARVSSLALYLNFRVAGFGGVPGSGLIGRVGFHNFQVKFSNPDTQILTDTRYSGVLLGGEFRFPINPNLKMNLGFNYFPVVKVEENPVSSGQDQSSVGGEFYVGGKLRLGGRLWLTMRYEYSGFLTEFSGMGDRSGGITGAKTRDLLQSFLFGLSFEF